MTDDFSLSAVLIVSAFMVVMTFLSFLPVFMIEKQTKEVKKNYRFTRLYCYLFLLPVMILFYTLLVNIGAFSEEGEAGGWFLIFWLVYYPIGVCFLMIPVFLDKLVQSVANKKKT